MNFAWPSFARSYPRWLGLAVLCFFIANAEAEPTGGDRYGPGSGLDTLTVGSVVYRQVKVKSVNARTVLFLHENGMASVKLSELAPEMQQRFGYDSAAEEASDQAMQAAIAVREDRQAKAAAMRKEQLHRSQPKLQQVLKEFGHPAVLREEVDMRPQFHALSLYAKSQGHRPSCSVFAVVSALEFLQAEKTNKPLKYSEEYLIWATGRTIQQLGGVVQSRNETGDDADAGFALTEVVTALRAYGIPPAESMPNSVGMRNNEVETPSPDVIAEAQSRTQVAVHLVPGRDKATQLNNMVHALNAGIPVTIGTAWPRFTNMRASLLDSQIPSYSHAVTLVGYTCSTGQLKDVIFIFKNSWGAKWGAGGYGYATFGYLEQHLNSAILLELQSP